MNPGICGFQKGTEKDSETQVPCTENLATPEEGFAVGSSGDYIHNKILHHLGLEQTSPFWLVCEGRPGPPTRFPSSLVPLPPPPSSAPTGFNTDDCPLGSPPGHPSPVPAL